ncbi:hypothetical protein ABW20_dc0109440 [Dactylellina cionopaga]|nr:hypothetical protein ABW20_dc0109440 [Dactylellina cionopaga]
MAAKKIRPKTVSVIYTLYQYIWTCPKDGSDDRTICDLGDRTLDLIEPHAYDVYDFYIEPYYSEYLSPYVDKAAPYVIVANERYGKPLLLEAKKELLEGYTSFVEPHVKTLEVQGGVLYKAYLADLVAMGEEIYDAYSPTVKKYSQQGYDFALEKAHPYYVASLPYLEKGWEEGISAAGWVGVEGKGWVARRWGMHVEPQLWRIQERLGMKGLRHGTPVKDGDPTPPHHGNPNASSSDTAPDGDIDNDYNDAPQSDDQGAKSEEPKKKSTAEQIAEARPLVEADLVAWGEKFEETGSKASADVVSNLDILCGKVLKEQTPLSIKLLEEFDTRIEKEFRDFDEGLGQLLDSPAEHKYVMIGYAGLVGRTYDNLKNKHGQITEHTQNFLMDTYQTTAKIVDAALAEMDSVHDVGMQELGMKWAWMDGVTYKDWAKYHELKQNLGSLKTKVIRSGQGHKQLREVTDYAKSIDDAAAELLKIARQEVAKLEIAGRKKLEDAEQARIAAEDKEPGEKPSAEKMGDAEIDNHGGVVEEVPKSDATNLKEVPEPEVEKEQSTELEKDESNLTADQRQKSDSQQESNPEPETTNKGQIAPKKQAEPESESEPQAPKAEGSTSEANEQPKPETPAKEAERETSTEPELGPEANQPEAHRQPEHQKEESEPATKEEPELAAEEEPETKSTEGSGSEAKPEPEANQQEPAASAQQEPASEETKAEANTATEPAAEEPTLKVQKQSHKEDMGVKVDNYDQPIDEPEALPKPAGEKIIEKDEL